MITKKSDIYKICSHPSLDFYIFPNQKNQATQLWFVFELPTIKNWILLDFTGLPYIIK